MAQQTVDDHFHADKQNFELVGVRLAGVRKEVGEAINRRPKHLDGDVNIIAVSKHKESELIVKAYLEGQRHFGENYVQELLTKANSSLIQESCPEIKWHFIGSLQSNKIKKIAVGCPNLYMIQTIEKSSEADVLQSALEKIEPEKTMNVMIQVNTSREANKSGVLAENAEGLLGHIIKKCPLLKVQGLMTIGSANHIPDELNPDFLTLAHLRDLLHKQYDLFLELSMGMSRDFQQAILLGSNYVRVGEKIFGARIGKFQSPKNCS